MHALVVDVARLYMICGIVASFLLLLFLSGRALALTCGFGSDIGNGQCRGFITTTGAGTWTVPADWSSTNKIETIGGGGGGALDAAGNFGGGGGGGGAYAYASNVEGLSGTVSVSVGVGGTADGQSGGDTWFGAATCGGAIVCAGAGAGAPNQNGGAGGTVQVGSGVSGGAGGASLDNDNNAGGGGGGGAAGPGSGTGGAGRDGGDNLAASDGGGGGGGAGGLSSTAGGDSVSTHDGGNGGDGPSGSGGGAGGVTATPGQNGALGGGGGGGANDAGAENGGDGGAGTEWVTAGAGGGGGGGSDLGIPGNGGLYGGGGGGEGEDSISGGGDGAQGIIVITYTPAAGRFVLFRPANNLGLAGYWSFDDGAGTVATDFSGNGNHAAFNNISDPATATSGWVPGKRGKAVALDGSNDFATTGNDPGALDLTGRITIAAWVKKSSLSGFDNIVNKASASELQYGIVTNGTKFAFNYGDFFAFETVQSLQVNAWYHLVATYDDVANDIDLFVNGVEVAGTDAFDDPENGAIVSSNEPLVFGEFINGEECDCVLDEVRIYNRVLTSSEIERLYRGGAVKISASSVELQRGSSLESGLVGHWTFDGADTQSAITDRSGSGNHGYFQGGATSSAKTIGKLGQGLRFDGSASYVPISATAFSGYPTSGNTGVYNLTFAAWFKTGDDGVILGQTNSCSPSTACTSYVPAIYVDTAGILRASVFWHNAVSNQNTSSSPVNDGAWHHVVATYANGVERLYLDGAEIDSQTFNQYGYGSGYVYFLGTGYSAGAWPSTNGGWFYFEGTLDDARVYNRALSASEIKELYALGRVIIRQ